MKSIGAVLGTLAIGKLVKDSTQMAMGVESSIENINRNMGESAHAFNNWAETQSHAWGMARADAYKYGGTYSNLLSSFTSGTKETANKTQELMKASAIIASKTGRTYEDTAERIRSGMLGSTEAIEDLGIYTNVSMLESTDAFRKFAGDSSWAKLDFQTQQQIRLAAILEQTYKRYGDTLEDTTQTRHAMFIASLKNIQLSLGQAFIPIYNAVLPLLTAMANAIGKVVSIIAQFTAALFGSAKIGKTQANTINSQVSGMQDLGKATTGAGKAATDAGKAAKKASKEAKGSLAGFDQINSLSQNKGSSGDSGSGSGGAGGGTVDIPSLDTGLGGFADTTIEVSESVQKMADKVKKAFKDIDKFIKKNKRSIVSSLAGIGAGIGTYLIGNNWKTIQKVGPNALKVLSKAIKGINAPILAISIVIGLFVKAIIELWDENKKFRDNLIKAWNNIKSVLNSIWNSVLKHIFKAFVDMLKDIYKDGIKPLWNNFKEFVNQLVSLMADWINAMTPVFNWIIKTFGPGIVELFKGLFNQIKNTVTSIINIVKSILEAFSGVISGVRQIFKGLIDFVVGVFTGDWRRAWDGIKSIFSGVLTLISSVWSGIKNVFSTITSYVANTFKNAWNTGWNTVKTIFSNVFNSLYGYVSPVLNNIRNAVTNAVNRIKNTVATIRTQFSNTFSALYSVIKAPLNNVIRAINNSLGKISISIPSWVPGLGGRKFSIPKIPMLAQGGYIGANSPTLAMIGDNRHEGEIVAPESKIYEQTFKAISDALGSSGGNNRPIDLTINLGSTTIFKEIINGINTLQRQAGKTLIEV